MWVRDRGGWGCRTGASKEPRLPVSPLTTFWTVSFQCDAVIRAIRGVEERAGVDVASSRSLGSEREDECGQKKLEEVCDQRAGVHDIRGIPTTIGPERSGTAVLSCNLS